MCFAHAYGTIKDQILLRLYERYRLQFLPAQRWRDLHLCILLSFECYVHREFCPLYETLTFVPLTSLYFQC